MQKMNKYNRTKQKGGVILKLKNYSKYLLFICFISSIVLLSTNLTDKGGNRNEDKPNRIIIELPKEVYVPYSNDSINDEGARIAIPTTTNGTSKSSVQKLPVPDVNEPIIISPLT
jgi:hypothetical protein